MGNQFCCPDRDQNVSEGTILFSSDDVSLPPKSSGANWFQGPSPPASPITHATRELNKAAAEEERLASGWFQRQAAAARADREAVIARERQDTRDRAEAADKHAAELKAAAKVAAMQAEFHKDGWFSAAPSPHKQQTEEEKAGGGQRWLALAHYASLLPLTISLFTPAAQSPWYAVDNPLTWRGGHLKGVVRRISTEPTQHRDTPESAYT